MEIIIALSVAILFVVLALTIGTRDRLKQLEEERVKLLAEIGHLKGTVETLTEEMTALRANVDFVNGELKSTQEHNAVAEKEIQYFNEGLTNILNYSVDKAKGGRK